MHALLSCLRAVSQATGSNIPQQEIPQTRTSHFSLFFAPPSFPFFNNNNNRRGFFLEETNGRAGRISPESSKDCKEGRRRGYLTFTLILESALKTWVELGAEREYERETSPVIVASEGGRARWTRSSHPAIW